MGVAHFHNGRSPYVVQKMLTSSTPSTVVMEKKFRADGDVLPLTPPESLAFAWRKVSST